MFYHYYFLMLFRSILALAALCALLPSPAQSACTFTLDSSSATFSSASNSSVVHVTASASNCAWTAVSNTAWILISFGSSGTGTGSVGFAILQNNTFSMRSGSLTIAGIAFNVTQAGAACTYGLSPSNATVAAAGASGSFNVTSGCSWTATSNADWLTASGSATGNGVVNYSADPNPNTTSRSGTISVGTSNFTVTQTAACSFTLTPTNAQVAATGGSGTFQIQPSASSCAWNATSNNPDFITVTSGASGTGNGTIGYTVSANLTTDPRFGTIAAGTNAFTIFQPGGSPCSYMLSPASVSLTSFGGSGSFSVTNLSACPWSPTTSVDWITFSAPTANSGNGNVAYFAAPNITSIARSGTIIIGNTGFVINEAGVPCTVTVSRNSIAAPAAGANGSIDVTAPDSCNWNAASNASWILLPTTSGSAQAPQPYTIAPSTIPKQRTGTITIANQVVKVTQDAADCTLLLAPDHAGLPAGSGNYTLHVSTACDYTATSNSGWIRILSGAGGSGESDVSYSVSANSSADARVGSINISGQTFTISQSGTSCSLALDPTSTSLPSTGGSGVINVTATNSCRWDPTTDSTWIKFTYAAVNGSGKINYTVAPAAGVTRTGRIFVSNQTFTVIEDGRPVLQFSSDGVVNDASYLGGPIAPGEIVAIFGIGIGPNDPATLQLSADQQFITTALAATRVLFDGIPAPLLYVSSTQIVAIVPYEIAGQTSTQMQIEYLGFQSSSVQLNVAQSAPGLFTADSSGAGPGAILNQNLSPNTSARPAPKNSFVTLFVTGEGQTRPPGVDGNLAGSPAPMPVQNVTATIAGINAPVQYAGGAPGLTAGVMQVNVRVPPTAPSGAQLVVVRVGNAASQTKVTVFVQ